MARAPGPRPPSPAALCGVVALACSREPPGRGGSSGPITEAGCGDLVAEIEIDQRSGALPFDTTLSASATCAEGEVDLQWTLTGPAGTDQASSASVSRTWLWSGEVAVALAATDGEGRVATASATITVYPPECPEMERTQILGVLENDELDEASGLVQGRVNPDLLWTHNDSGDAPRLFALTEAGEHVAVLELEGAPDGDWEDIAIWEDPDSGEVLLLVGDIGDNEGSRAALVIFVLPEPEVGADTLSTDAWQTIEVTFPDNASLNADTLMVDPVTGDLYLAAVDADGSTGIYRAAAPWDTATPMPLERVASVNPGEGDAVFTGGEFSPLGDRILLRTQDEARMWLRDQSTGMDAAWAATPCEVPIATEPRGEAIAFSASGDGYFTVSEEQHQPIYFTAFVPPEGPCEGFEPRILTGEKAGEIPFEPALSIDESCVPAGIAAVTWDLGDGSDPVTGTTASPLYLASGSYEVTAEVTDLDGVTEKATLALEVQPAECPEPGDTVTWGTVESADIIEASGLGHSSQSQGVLWTHNDAGDRARLFAFAEDGTHLGEFEVDVSARDWEDLTLGWDDTVGGPAIYVGDIGDNGESRDEIEVVVIAEPAVDATAEPVEASLSPAAVLQLTYPDGPRNAETLMWDPVTGDLFIVTKSYEGDTAIFQKPAPHTDGSRTELTLVAELTFGAGSLAGHTATTAGDFSVLGDQIAIRTYSSLYLWRRDQADSLSETFATEPCNLDPPSERQGEAMTFATDRSGYLLLSEGVNQNLYFIPLD